MNEYYPHSDGSFIVLGPQIFTDDDGRVINWKGQNYIRQDLSVNTKTDIVQSDGTHIYWSTHCRHGNHNACNATELAPGVPRKPAQCKTCSANCVCECHHINDEES